MSHSTDRTSPVVAVAGAAVLALAGLFVGLLLGVISISLVSSVVPLPSNSPERNAVALIAQGAGLVAVAALYMDRHDLPWSYLRISKPSLRDIGFAIAATVVLFGALALASAIIDQLGLTTTEHSVTQSAEENPAALLPLIPLSILITGPTEELLFRGVIQTRLRDALGTPAGGVVVAAAVFSLVHIPAYGLTSGLGPALATTLVVLFVLGGLLGAAYEYTGNLLVPIIAHGVYNAVVFGSNYAEAVGAF
jgi:membrane protease YdiL (CAAX protease family)